MTELTHVVLRDEKVIAVTNDEGTLDDARAFAQSMVRTSLGMGADAFEWTQTGRLLHDGLNTGFEIVTVPTVEEGK